MQNHVLRNNVNVKKKISIYTEAATRCVLSIKLFLKVSQYPQKNKLQAATLLKRDRCFPASIYFPVYITQIFSCGCCEIFRHRYFKEHPQTSGSFHNFLVNALRAGLISPSLENSYSMGDVPIPFFNFFWAHHLNIFLALDNIVLWNKG